VVFYQNPVEANALTKMVVSFYQKLMYITESRLTLAARSLTDYIENKLKSALEFDTETGRPYLAIEDQVCYIQWKFVNNLSTTGMLTEIILKRWTHSYTSKTIKSMRNHKCTTNEMAYIYYRHYIEVAVILYFQHTKETISVITT